MYSTNQIPPSVTTAFKSLPIRDATLQTHRSQSIKSSEIIFPTFTNSQINYPERETATILKMADMATYLNRQLYGAGMAPKKTGKEAKRLDVYGGYWSLLKSSDEDLEGMVLVTWSKTKKLWGGHNQITGYETDMDSTGKCYLKVR